MRLRLKLAVGASRAVNLRSESKSPVETTLMRTLKTALDPRGLMNPGKVLR